MTKPADTLQNDTEHLLNVILQRTDCHCDDVKSEAYYRSVAVPSVCTLPYCTVHAKLHWTQWVVWSSLRYQPALLISLWCNNPRCKFIHQWNNSQLAGMFLYALSWFLFLWVPRCCSLRPDLFANRFQQTRRLRFVFINVSQTRLSVEDRLCQENKKNWKKTCLMTCEWK